MSSIGSWVVTQRSWAQSLLYTRSYIARETKVELNLLEMKTCLLPLYLKTFSSMYKGVKVQAGIHSRFLFQVMTFFATNLRSIYNAIERFLHTFLFLHRI